MLKESSVVLRTMRLDTAAGSDTYALHALGAFVEIERRSYSWARRYTVESWLDELPTHSDHRFLDAVTRDALFKDLSPELSKLGESFTLQYHRRPVAAVRAIYRPAPAQPLCHRSGVRLPK
jgi:hypothetical protein